MPTDSAAIWDGLNERQRTYLHSLFTCDQETEGGRRSLASGGTYDRTPASEWRWQLYGPVSPPSKLYRMLRIAGLVDHGSGATWQALELRGLVATRMRREPLGDFLEVQITPLGRKVVRAATGQQRPKAPPKGQLRERQWAALVRLYVAGTAGERIDDMLYGRKSFDWMRTLLRLREYTPAPLMEEYRVPPHPKGDGTYTREETRMRLTAYGRDYYVREWARYRALYPTVEAPEPTS